MHTQVDGGYPRILTALGDSRRSMWAVVDAIVEEAARSKSGNRLRDGEAERISKYVRKHGHELSPTRIRHLYGVGWWVRHHPHFREHSVQRVIYVMRECHHDYDRAARLIRSPTTSRTLKHQTVQPLTRLRRAGAYLASAETALIGANLSTDEWDELDSAVKDIRAQLDRIGKLVAGEDFSEVVAALPRQAPVSERSADVA